jgi:hypothetical protein
MTDAALADALWSAKALEAAARAVFASSRDESERDAALLVVRHVTATRKSLEVWVGIRAMRTQIGRRA